MFVIEASLCSGRVFNSEIKWKTLSAVMMLPVSTASVAWSKVAGCALRAGPRHVLFPDRLSDCPQRFSGLGTALTSSGWWLAIFIQRFLHLSAFLSLIVKWGALPLAFDHDGRQLVLLARRDCGDVGHRSGRRRVGPDSARSHDHRGRRDVSGGRKLFAAVRNRPPIANGHSTGSEGRGEGREERERVEDGGWRGWRMEDRKATPRAWLDGQMRLLKAVFRANHQGGG